MSFSIFLFLLNFLLIICIKDGFFTFETNEQNQIIANISIGTPPQYFRILLDTSTIYLMIFPYDTKSKMNIKNKFNYSASRTFKKINYEINKEYLENHVTIKTVKDIITIANMTLNFSFLLIQDSNEFPDFDDIDGILGIGYKYEELYNNMYLFSLLEQLYNNSLISKKVYYINFDDNNKGIVQFGKKNKLLLKNKIGKCIPPHDGIKNMLIGKWQCVIKRIYIGKYMKNFTIYEREENKIDFITFDTGINFITVPEAFFNFIGKKLSKYINNNTCFYETLKGKRVYKRIKCINNFPHLFYYSDIYFTVGDHIMVLPYQSIYSDIDNYTYFNMITYKNNTNEFELGQILLKNFLIEFDKSSETISFYSKDYAIDTNVNHINVLITFSIFFIIFVIITYIIYILLINYVDVESFKNKYYEEEKKIINKSFEKGNNFLIPSNETSFNRSIASLTDINKLEEETENENEK